MASLRDILVSPKIQKFNGSDEALYDKVVAMAEQNVGHGISAEYFNSRFGLTGTITPVMLRKMVKSAPYWKGCFSKGDMALGLRHYRERQALLKQQAEEKENQ